jgi:hypothetical protein
MKIDTYSFIISRLVLLRIRNTSDNFVDKIKTHTLCSITLFFEKSVICEIMWKNILQQDKPELTIWRKRIAYQRPQTHTQKSMMKQQMHKWSTIYHTYYSCYNVPTCFDAIASSSGGSWLVPAKLHQNLIAVLVIHLNFTNYTVLTF